MAKLPPSCTVGNLGSRLGSVRTKSQNFVLLPPFDKRLQTRAAEEQHASIILFSRHKAPWELAALLSGLRSLRLLGRPGAEAPAFVF